ncbi:hypothetical protein SAMN04488137_4633 [Fictibacillus solisalsi]|uniref:Uncharacterized protein n=1 Tax=Fictibacillus solisalsi TaxID=459525 RepID=A0A1H0BRP2_9BACL|nr:hypothetical protein [Fictibacillus solisalsi]SDN48266.1 hypothetical protein SAMN04488137_4633 [Fictibacillus solisalsi]
MIEYFKFVDGVRIVTKIEQDPTARLKERAASLEKQGFTEEPTTINKCLFELEEVVNEQK